MSNDGDAPTGVQEETGRPSVRLTRNASGNVQIDVKVYANACDELAVEAAEAVARATFDRLVQTYPMTVGGRK